MRRYSWFALGLVLLVAAGCSGGDADGTGRAAQIDCTAAYRANPGAAIEREEVLAIPDADDRQRLHMGDLVLSTVYAAGLSDNERNLRLAVTTAEDDALLLTLLLQLPTGSGPTDQFVGDHGFTGLHYVYHPVSGSELQFWCQVGQPEE